MASAKMTKLGVVMDPIASIKVEKDSTLAMLLAAQARGWELWYMELSDLVLHGASLTAAMRPLTVQDDPGHWFDLGSPQMAPVAELDVVLMRKDPPFDMEYIYATYLLELAEQEGVLVVNRPAALRDANEKVFAAHFPQCIPPTVIARKSTAIKEFLEEHSSIVVKPLDGMGGTSVFRLQRGDPNTNVVLETLTQNGRRFAMAQRFIPEVETQGDKRILLIDGEPFPHALARLPAAGESRANLAVGGKGQGVDLSQRDLWLCQQVAPTLREKGLLFVGLDVIGDHVTEINVTSPTCIRELDRIYDADIAGLLMDRIAAQLTE